MNAKSIFELLKLSAKEWSEDNCSRLAAATSYYAIFSLGPLLLIGIAIAGFVLGQEAVQGQVEQQIGGIVGEDAAEAIQTMIANAYRAGGGLISTIIGVVGILFSASGVVRELKGSLNQIWEVDPVHRDFKGTIVTYVVSLLMVLGVGALLLAALAASAGITALGNLVGDALPGNEIVWQIVNTLLSLVIVTLAFAGIYRVLPDADVDWRDVWIGAAVTAVLFTIGKILIGLYLGQASYANTFGAAGSIVVLLVWIYYSAQIFFFGAEFTQVYATKYGSKIAPNQDSEAVVDENVHAVPRGEHQAAKTQRDRSKGFLRPDGGMDRDQAGDSGEEGTGNRERVGQRAHAGSRRSQTDRRDGMASHPIGSPARQPTKSNGGSGAIRGVAVMVAGALAFMRMRSRDDGKREPERPERERSS